MWGGTFLAWLFHHELIVSTIAAVSISGILIILTTNLNLFILRPITLLFAFFSAFCFIAILRSDYATRFLFVPSKTVKKRRSIPVHTSVIVGVIGAVMSLGLFTFSTTQADYETRIIVCAYAFIAIALLLTWDLFVLKNLTEQTTLALFVPLAISGILPLILANETIRNYCGIFILLVTVLYGLLIVTSVVELVRFNQLATIRAFGFCGLHYLTGALLGWAVCYIGEMFLSDLVRQWTMIIVVWLLVIAGFYLFKPHNDIYWDVDPSEGIKSVSIQNAGWRTKVEEVAKEHSLSSRQTEILFLLAKGRNATYLQKEFYIAKGTAKSHISNIYRKLGVHSQQELMDMFDKKR
jgi:DNA-binding CsgD family transcriptional regulator